MGKAGGGVTRVVSDHSGFSVLRVMSNVSIGGQTAAEMNKACGAQAQAQGHRRRMATMNA